MSPQPAQCPADYDPATADFADQVILVSGASGALGRQVSLMAAAAGATVVIAGQSISKLEALYDEIEAAGGPSAAIVPINLAGASFKDYVQIADQLRTSLGRLDGLLHAAAHFKGCYPIQEIEPQDWINNLQVNLTATWALTRACLPLLQDAEASSVVTVNDEARAYMGAYGLAKAAQRALAETWAAELGEQAIRPRFNQLQPGPMRSGLRERGFPGETIHETPGPEAAARAALWLLDRQSAPLHGAIISGG